MGFHNLYYPKILSKEIVFALLVSLIAGFLLIQFSFYAAISILLIGALILCTQRRDFNFYFLLFLVPIDRFYFPLVYRLKAYQIVLIGAVIFGIATAIINKKSLRFNWNFLDASILLIFLGRILSGLVAIDYIVYFKALILYCLFILLYFYIRHMATSIEPEKMLRYVIYTSTVFLAFGILEFILGKFGVVPIQTVASIYVYGGRPWSVFREPDWFGGYLTFIIGLTFPFAYLKYYSEKMYKINKLILYFALLMSLLIVVRSAWLGLLIGISFISIFGKRARGIILSGAGKIFVIILFCLMLMSAFSLSHYKSVQDRFMSIFAYLEHKRYDPAVQARINSYEAIIGYIKERPLQGYGAGAWEYLSQRHKHINPSLSATNVLLTPIFEMGILGVFLYLMFFLALFKMIFAGIRYAVTDIELRYVTGIVIAVLGSLIVSIFNDIMLTGFYWAFIAIFNSYIISLKKENRESLLSINKEVL